MKLSRFIHKLRTSDNLLMNKRYNLRLGSLWADAFRGHGLSLLKKTTLRGLRTHAIPAGVTARRSPRLVCAFLIVIFIILLSQQLFFCSKQRVLTIKVQFAPTLAEEKHEDSCGRSVKYGHVL